MLYIVIKSVTIFIRYKFIFWLVSPCFVTGNTLTMTRRTANRPPVPLGECVAARLANPVIPWTANTTPWSLGVYPTRATGTTTGQDCTAELNGMASSVLPSLTLNLWGNRYKLIRIHNKKCTLTVQIWFLSFPLPPPLDKNSKFADCQYVLGYVSSSLLTTSPNLRLSYDLDSVRPEYITVKTYL